MPPQLRLEELAMAPLVGNAAEQLASLRVPLFLKSLLEPRVVVSREAGEQVRGLLQATVELQGPR
eukprot:10988630-Alexandrium_andersonii.AAC.1